MQALVLAKSSLRGLGWISVLFFRGERGGPLPVHRGARPRVQSEGLAGHASRAVAPGDSPEVRLGDSSGCRRRTTLTETPKQSLA